MIAEDLMPDAVSAQDAIGATAIDDRYFLAMPGLRGAILRRLPLPLAQAVEVLLHAHRYDAVVSWSDLPAILIAAVLCLHPRRPGHVAILHWPSKPKKAIPLRLVSRGIDRIIAWAPLQRRFLEQELKFPSECFVDVGPPFDTHFWRPMPSAGDLICSVGQEMRDYGTLVEALRPLGIPCHIAAGTNIFSTTSENWWRSSLSGQILPEGLTVGQRSFVELRELYARARFVVVPVLPTDMDNGVTVIIESLLMGKAVICTDTAGRPDFLEHGVNCRLVPTGDVDALREAITELWSDPDECNRLGAAGREVVLGRNGLDRWTAGLMRAVHESAAARS
jgi:glycosyltransferase involved in cell wall biosynthesis